MKNDKDLQKMIEEAANIDQDYEDSSKSNKKGIIIFVLFFVVVAVIVFAGSQVLKPQEFVNKTEAPDLDDGRGELISNDNSSEIVWGFKKPAKTPEWASRPFNENMLNDKDFLNNVYSYAEDYQGVLTAFGYKPSEEHGYTSNPVDEELMDEELGITLPNNMYTYATKEDYYKAFSIYTQMLINPVFGDWAFAEDTEQMYEGNPFDKFSNIFTDDWWNENIVAEGNYNNLPILYDWENDRFRGLLDDVKTNSIEYSVRSSFYGEIIEDNDNYYIESNISNSDDAEGNEIISIDLPVTYKAFNKDSEVIEIDANLHLEFEINEDIVKESSRVLISNAEIKYNDIDN